MSNWGYLAKLAEEIGESDIDPTVGDRGMTRLDGLIFCEVIVRMQDKAREKSLSLPKEEIVQEIARLNRDEVTMWHNANRSVNW
jgi:hypothetical protein